MSWDVKIRHHNTAINPECLYAAECLPLEVKWEIEELKEKERKVLRTIYDLKRKKQGTGESNKEIYLV